MAVRPLCCSSGGALLRRVVSWLGSVLLFLLLVDGLVRVVNPTPRIQVIRAQEGVALGELGDVVVWRVDSPEVDAAACDGAPADVAVAAFVGSSILRGSGAEGPAVHSEVLRQRLPPGTWCVENHAQPGFTAEQKAAVALDLLAQPGRLDRIYWEVWQNDLGHFLRVGDAAYNVDDYPIDAHGRPTLPGTPDALSALLFDHAASWRYAVLALGRTQREGAALPGAWRSMLAASLEPVLAAAAARGTEVVLVLCPTLDHPFAWSQAHTYPGYALALELAAARGLRVIRLDEALGGLDVEAVRADPCCHYNAVGQGHLADVFYGDLMGR